MRGREEKKFFNIGGKLVNRWLKTLLEQVCMRLQAVDNGKWKRWTNKDAPCQNQLIREM